jgi:hypothetical protein
MKYPAYCSNRLKLRIEVIMLMDQHAVHVPVPPTAHPAKPGHSAQIKQPKHTCKSFVRA